MSEERKTGSLARHSEGTPKERQPYVRVRERLPRTEIVGEGDPEFHGPSPLAPFTVYPADRNLGLNYMVKNRHGHLVGAFVQGSMAQWFAAMLAISGEGVDEFFGFLVDQETYFREK